MKKLLILSLLIPSIVYGQAMTVRNDEAFNGTGYVVGNGNHLQPLNLDRS